MTKDESYHSGFHYSPGRKELQAIFGTTSQTGYLLLFFSVRKKKYSTVQVEARRPEIRNVRGLHRVPTLKAGCGMFSLPSFS